MNWFKFLVIVLALPTCIELRLVIDTLDYPPEPMSFLYMAAMGVIAAVVALD